MSALIAIALAREIAANAPDSLKPCAWPKTETRFALKTDPNYVAMTHVRRFRAVCEAGGGLLTSFAERGEPIDYASAPETPPAAMAVVPNSPPFSQDVVDEGMPSFSYPGAYGGGGFWGESVGSDLPLVSPVIASFGGLAPGANFTPVIYAPIPPAPELQTWLLMLAGMGAIALRRRA